VVVVPEFRRAENPTFSTESARSSLSNHPSELSLAIVQNGQKLLSYLSLATYPIKEWFARALASDNAGL
jgi:hypothetical protein